MCGGQTTGASGICSDGGAGLEVVTVVTYLTPTHQSELTMARSNPVQFVQETRAEIAKVVWPSRREVTLTTIMVFLLAAIAAVFFSIVDLGIRQGLAAVLTAFGS